MTVKMTYAAKAVVRFLGSTLAWRLVLALFFFEALWLVFSAQYPMAFDENYHFGLIQLHAQQWLPFFTSQPRNASAYGAVVRDPSYLYHWLMSFPYRLIALFTTNQTTQIIFLRLINVGLFGLAITLCRRIVRRLGVSQSLATCLFAVFILIPVVPFLAAHINYDNLFFVAISVTILLVIRLLDRMYEEKAIDARTFCLLLAVLLLSSLIKYPYLPVAFMAIVFLFWHACRAGVVNKEGWHLFRRSFISLRMVYRIGLVLFILVSLGLFSERYVENIVKYHNPVPACDAVISEDECVNYGPYGRDHAYKQQKPTVFHPNIFMYIWDWCYGMWLRLFFAINYDYSTAQPLLFLGIVAAAAGILLIIGLMLKATRLFKQNPPRQLVALLTLGYVFVLFADGFESYTTTAQPVAINGRYLIPFLPFILALGGLAWSWILHSQRQVKVSVAVFVIAIFLLQGGGTMTFIIRSGDNWMWNNATVRSTNRVVRSAAWSFILGKGPY